MINQSFIMKHIILQVPSSENGTLMKGRVQQPVLERINVAHDFASAELLNLIIHKVLLLETIPHSNLQGRSEPCWFRQFHFGPSQSDEVSSLQMYKYS
jgi:hypothetical protein